MQVYNVVEWRSKDLSSFYVCGISLFVALVASPFYAWGIKELMDKTEGTSAMRNGFSFGDEIAIVVGIFLVFACYNDVNKELRKSALLLTAVLALKRVVATITPEPQNTQSGRGVVQKSQSTGKMPLTMLSVAAMTGVCVIIEAENTNVSAARIQQIISSVSPDTGAHASSVQSILNHISSFADDRVALAVNSAAEAVDRFYIAMIPSSFWIVSTATTVIGFLYLLLVPFLLWFGQGWNMLYTYPVYFLIVGGGLAYRLHLRDAVNSPTRMSMLGVHTQIWDTVAGAQKTYMTAGYRGDTMSNILISCNILKTG
jgi:hypothetical protein